MTVDLQRQLDTATAFFLAGERCSFELKFGDYGLHRLDAPTVVDYAFSVELALKLLCVVTSTKVTRSHRLKSLFDALPSETKSALPYLEGCVDEIDRYFEVWRYPFEKDSLLGEFDNPRRAFIECYREIRRLRPDLMSAFEKNWGSFEPDWLAMHAIRGPVEIKDRIGI